MVSSPIIEMSSFLDFSFFRLFQIKLILSILRLYTYNKMVCLKDVVKTRMDEMLESFVDDLTQLQDWERTSEYISDYYSDEWQQWFNSGEEWWDFIPEEDLTIRNMNELLANFKEMEEEFGRGEAGDGSTVDKLLRLYGYWTASKEASRYIQMLEDRMLENNQPSDNN